MERAASSEPPEFSAAELGALAHLYRAEMYRSKVWRLRLDATTNWAVGLAGLALSITFSAADNTPLPLILAGLVVILFLFIEARRYRYFDIWRTRTRLLEVSFFRPMLTRQPILDGSAWNHVLAEDLSHVQFHISMWEAGGRRLRRNYIWIFGVLGASYIAKLLVHPTPLASLDHLWDRAAIGPIAGQVTIGTGVLLYSGLAIWALITLLRQQAVGRAHFYSGPPGHEDPIRRMGL
jgi:uncharacterized membrane protein